MRILANILRTFKVSSRESCKITNRRYSSQICPRIRGSSSVNSPAVNVVCVRSFTTTPVECKGNGTADTFNSSSGNSESNYQIIPVALLKTESELDASPVKVLVIPINLFNNDKEAVQKTMSAMSVIRENADRIDAFTDNAAAFATKNSNAQNSNVLGTPKRRIDEPLWQNFNSEPEGVFTRDGLDEALAGHEVNRIKSRNSFDALDWSDGKGYIIADVPPNLEKRFADAGIASMDLAFEMDMTNIKDALMMRDRMSNDLDDYHDPVTMTLRDPMISMTASVETDTFDINSTVPLNFNALIQGTVNIDSSKLTPEEIEVPQFNDYVTSMAANICSTALQKGFPTDVSRMYSTKTTEEPKRPRSPHIVCERQGDKGCISPGNSNLDPYVPKGQNGAVHSMGTESERTVGKCAESSLLTSTIIGDAGARGLMSCKAYAIALKEAERLREVFAAAKKSKCAPPKEEQKCADERKNPCAGKKVEGEDDKCPKMPCGPPKQDSICKDKILRDPPTREPGNDRCFPQDAPCKKADAKPCPEMKVEQKQCADAKPSQEKNCPEKKVEEKQCTASKPAQAEKCAEKKVEKKQCDDGKSTSSARKADAKPAEAVSCPETVKKEQKSCAEAKPACGQAKSAEVKCPEAKVAEKQCAQPGPMAKPCAEMKSAPKTAAETASKTEKCADSKSAPVVLFKDDDKPCNSIPFKCPIPEKKEKTEQKDWDKNPCRQNYPKQCPPKTSVGGCKRPVVDPCAPQGDCSKPQEEKKNEKPCKTDPCGSGGKKASSVESSAIADKPEPILSVMPKENFTFRACEAFKKACGKRTAPKDCEAPAGKGEQVHENDHEPSRLAKPTVVIASDFLAKEPKRPRNYSDKLAESAATLTNNPITIDLCQLPVSQFSKPDNTKTERRSLRSSSTGPTKNHSRKSCASKAPPKTCSKPSEKKASSSSNATVCPNTTAVSAKSTKPNCPKNGSSGSKSARCFSTLFARRLFTAAFSSSAAIPVANHQMGNYFLGPVNFYSNKTNGKDGADVDCPPGPPKPRQRFDIKVEKGLRDCFAQNRLDEPCPDTRDHSKSSCNKKPESRGCLDDFDENKLWKRSPTLLLNPGLPCTYLLNRNQQVRAFSSSSVLNQNEKYKFEEHEENEDSPKPRQKVPRLQRPSETKVLENEIVRIGAAGEVLKVAEPIQDVTDYDILVRVGAIALSGSDIHVYETGGDKCTGITIGHDATGIVEKVGKCVDKLKPGDCVAMESGLCCGICDVCKQGNYNLCPQLFHNGFFSTHQTHPADLCHKIPDNVTLEDATLTSILALGLQACFKAEITPTTNVLVIGTSPKACAAALCARALGAKSVAVMAPNVYTLESIRILFDFDYVHYYENETNLMEKVTERVCTVLKDRPNVVINYAISESSMNMAISLLKPGGKCVLAECDNEYASFNAMDVLMKSISLITSFRSANMFPAALNLMKSGKTPIGELVSRIYTWDQIKWAFHWAQYEANMGNRKVIVQGPDLL